MVEVGDVGMVMDQRRVPEHVRTGLARWVGRGVLVLVVIVVTRSPGGSRVRLLAAEAARSIASIRRYAILRVVAARARMDRWRGPSPVRARASGP